MLYYYLQICWGLKLYSTETWALITARAIIGLGVSGSYVVTPLYIKEISEDSIRGTLGSLVVLSQNLGNLLVYILGEYLCYQATLWICLAVPLIHLLLFPAMPETPSYLLKSGKVEVSIQVLLPNSLLLLFYLFRIPLESLRGITGPTRRGPLDLSLFNVTHQPGPISK